VLCHRHRTVIDPIVELGGHEYFTLVQARPKKDVTAYENDH
jgi:hypothetical protein